ncbi:hypothetical protein [Neobacillus sp. Marseille-QA0830]
MSKSLWTTPEEYVRRKRLKKKAAYVFILLGTAVLSTLLTLLTNQY